MTDKPKIVKMSVNLSSEVIAVLRQLASRRNITMTEVLRRAISTEKFIDDLHEKGHKILIEDGNNLLRQLVLR